MYQKVDTNLNFVDREKETLKFWQENDIFQKSMDNRKEGETYTFYDGPPTANGKPHIGHVLTRVIKDMIPRYRTMKGYMVPRKAGWDTHGLPVELEVEKLLGLDGKEQIEHYLSRKRQKYQRTYCHKYLIANLHFHSAPQTDSRRCKSVSRHFYLCSTWHS